MKCVLRMLMFLIVGILLWYPKSGMASAAGSFLPISGGGAILPQSSETSIRMDEARVTVRLKKSTYTVDAVFQLFNTGDAVTEWVACPIYGCLASEIKPGFTRFDMWVDDQKMTFKEKVEKKKDLYQEATPGLVARMLSMLRSKKQTFKPPALVGPRWISHPIAFPGRSRITIRTSYKAYHVSSGLGSEPIASYAFGTSRLWKGNIGKVVFIVDGHDLGRFYEGYETNVGGIRRTVLVTELKGDLGSVSGPRRISGPSLIRFELRNVKPSPNVYFSVVLADYRHYYGYY